MFLVRCPADPLAAQKVFVTIFLQQLNRDLVVDVTFSNRAEPIRRAVMKMNVPHPGLEDLVRFFHGRESRPYGVHDIPVYCDVGMPHVFHQRGHVSWIAPGIMSLEADGDPSLSCMVGQ